MKVRPPRAQRCFVFGAALIVAVVERAAVGHLGIDAVARLLARKAPDFRIVRAERFAAPPPSAPRCGPESRNSAVRWNTVRWLACSAMTGIDWIADEPGADHADAQAGEIHRLMRPVAGVIDLALEIREALDIGHRAHSTGSRWRARRISRSRSCRRTVVTDQVLASSSKLGAVDAGVELDIARAG